MVRLELDSPHLHPTKIRYLLHRSSYVCVRISHSTSFTTLHDGAGPFDIWSHV